MLTYESVADGRAKVLIAMLAILTQLQDGSADLGWASSVQTQANAKKCDCMKGVANAV